MAIQFARMEYVSRSSGGNACLKASYNKRDAIRDEREGKKYSFANRGGNVHHEIMIPKGVNEKFLDSSMLWNEVEQFENRVNSQLAKEIVLALPDNKQITLDDRIELCRRFVAEHFTKNGLGVQIDIHEPHHVEDKNWHAHLLVTTRRFREDGQTFEKKKARDLEATVRKGFVVEGEKWGEIWKDLQNAYFKEKGLDIRVDAIGVIAQEHLGPVRMRHHMSEVVARGENLKVANQEASLKPDDILVALTKTRSVFTNKDIEAYLNKHVDEEHRDQVRVIVMEHPELVKLHDSATGELTGFYTTKSVRSEEEQVLRLAERIEGHKGINGGETPASYTFSEEQRKAAAYGLDAEHGLRIIQGRAGTGKSYLIAGMREAYEAHGQKVIGLAPTHTVVRDMVDAGFERAQTIHGFLFKYKNDRIKVPSGSVLMVDEAGMVGTAALGELLKVAEAQSCKVILVGDDRQLSSVERGGFFKVLAEKFGSVELSEVRRQEIQWQKQVSEDLSQGRIREAVHLLDEKKSIHWHGDGAHAVSALVEDYSRSIMVDPGKKRLILAHKNTDVDVMNQAIQRVRQAVGQVSTNEYVCSTLRGEVPFGVGDRVQFMKTDKALGITNGDMGILTEATNDLFTVQRDGGEVLTFNPSEYNGLRLGYASTIYKGQGKTVDEAYVLHSPLMTENLSYVALTRQVKDLHLYVSQEETKNQEVLINQMSRSDNRVVSLNFLTEHQIEREQRAQQSMFHKLAYGAGDQVKAVVQRLTDHLPNHSFYQVPASSEFKGGEVKEQSATERWKRETSEAPANKPSENDVSPLTRPSIREKGFKETYDIDRIEESLKKDIRGFATHLLGAPDLKLSTSRELCFRNDGKVFVNLESGLWKDFVNDTGGNLFDLIERERGGTFKDSLAYAAHYMGQGPERTPPSSRSSSKPVQEEVPQDKGEELRQKATRFYDKTVPLSATIGERYLREHRGIGGDIPNDIRFAPKTYNSEVQSEIPAVVSFMRDKEGKLTGYQTIYLEASTGSKADLDIAKRTHGSLSGSFVEIQKGEGKAYLAEGMETALSIKEAGVQGTILASLGVHNLKNYEGSIKDIVICADNDGQKSPSTKVIEKTKHHLIEKGYTVEITQPKEIGKDFNDVLVQTGKESVRAYFKDADAAPSLPAQTRIDAAKENIAKEDTAPQKTEERNRPLEGKSLSPWIERAFKEELISIYQEKLGDGAYRSHMGTIDRVAHRATEYALIKGMPESQKLRRVELSRAHYECQRLPELKESLIKSDSELFYNWTQHHLKAEALTVIEGNLHSFLRCQKPILTKADHKLIQEEAPKHLKAYTEKVDHYKEESLKDYGYAETQARFFAHQKALFETRFGVKPNETQEQALKKAVEYGHAQYEKHKLQWETQQTTKHGQLGEQALQYIDRSALYKAHMETKEVIMQTLASPEAAFPPRKELERIETKIGKEFKDDKLKYDQADKAQQKQQQLEQKQIQLQQQMQRNREMSL